MITDAWFWNALKYMTERVKCGFCRNKFSQGWVSVNNGRLVISGEMAFHWADSHGIDPETLETLFHHFFFDPDLLTTGD